MRFVWRTESYGRQWVALYRLAPIYNLAQVGWQYRVLYEFSEE